jgi:hypothetical protein
VYTYYEFWQPIESRLDDSTWKARTEAPLAGPFRPWLLGRGAGAGLQRATSRQELEMLLGEVDFDGENSCCFVPGRLNDYSNAARHIVGTRVRQEDLGVLFELVARPRVNLGVLAYALAALAEHSGDPRVLACYAAQVAELEADDSPLRTESEQLRFYYTVLGLGACGQDALAVVEQAARLLERADTRLREPYDAAIRQSRARIAAAPALDPRGSRP